jgi:hypothetical protein
LLPCIPPPKPVSGTGNGSIFLAVEIQPAVRNPAAGDQEGEQRSVSRETESAETGEYGEEG